MYGQSLKKVGQGVLELLIGNEKVTDGQTDRHAHLSFEGEHKNYCNIVKVLPLNHSKVIFKQTKKSFLQLSSER